MTNTKLRRLIDLAGIADLELKALMKPAWSAPEARLEFPEIDGCSRDLFGLTADEAEEAFKPSDLASIERLSAAEQVDPFAAKGWDVTDNKRRPLRMLAHFNQQLWLAIHGVAGQLPFQAEALEETSEWGSKMAGDAARFRKR